MSDSPQHLTLSLRLSDWASAQESFPDLHFDPAFEPIRIPKLRTSVEGRLLNQEDLDFDGTEVREVRRLLVAPGVAGQIREQLTDRNKELGQEPLYVYDELRLRPLSSVSPNMGRARGLFRNVRQRFRQPLRNRRWRGQGVKVAMVDDGVNEAFLTGSGGKAKQLGYTDRSAGWHTPPYGAGAWPTGHGTMMAYAVSLAAPYAQVLDYPALHCHPDGLATGIVRAYRDLLDYMLQQNAEDRRLVVNNSWGFSPDPDEGCDFRMRHTINDPGWELNRLIRLLALAGADVLFAAGNCGRDYRPEEEPKDVCGCPKTDDFSGINGPASHPDVLCIGAATIDRDRIGYSSTGPGKLMRKKPDVCAYAHFSGPQIAVHNFNVDEDGNCQSSAKLPTPAFERTRIYAGTSTACAVASGIVAAVRTKYPAHQLPPAKLRKIIRDTAVLRGGTSTGHANDYGHGVISAKHLAEKLARL